MADEKRRFLQAYSLTEYYTYVSNMLMHDRRLSLNARGLMIVLSLPEKWDFTISGLSMMRGISQDAVNHCIKELCTLGYVEVRQPKDRRDSRKRITSFVKSWKALFRHWIIRQRNVRKRKRRSN